MFLRSNKSIERKKRISIESLATEMLILSIKNTMIIIKLSSKIKHITENQYKNIIQSLNFDELSCPKCNSKGLRVHASYSRYVDFFKRSHKITIQRLRCPECGSTHAVLIEDMIPYSIASYDLIVDVLVGIDFLVSSHAAYLKDKYLTCPFDYDSFCEMNTRKNYLNFFCFFT